MNYIEMRTTIERAWSKETTFCPEDYDEHDPAWGQCVVTSILLTDICEEATLAVGTVINEEHGIETMHCWNVVRGLDIDLTWRQFPSGSAVEDIHYNVDVDDLLQDDWMDQRYQNMKANYNFLTSEVGRLFT